MIILLSKTRNIIAVQRERDDGADDFSSLKGFDFMSLVAEDYRDAAGSFFTEIDKSEKSSSCTLRLDVSPTYSPEFICSARRGEDGNVQILARKKPAPAAENEQLVSAMKKIRVLFEKTPVAMILVDTRGDIEAVNPIASRMFGYSSTAWRSMNLSSVLLKEPVSNSAETSAKLMSFIVEHCGSMCRLLGKRENGHTFPLELFAERLDDSGTTLLLSIFDISQRVELEQKKKEFVQMISHDLRTPLTNMSIFLETILMGLYRDRPSESLEDSARVLNDDISRLIRLISQLLTIDKLEQGFNQPKRRKLSINSLLQAALVSIESLASAKELTIETKVSSDFEAEVDRDQIVQVLVNLVGNAIKFSPAGGKVTIEAALLEDFFEVRVIDQGPGVPENLKERVFDRFLQIEGPKTTAEGSGLGLAICKALVAGHGGHIGVDSEEGKGSAFWFRIPNLRTGS